MPLPRALTSAAALLAALGVGFATARFTDDPHTAIGDQLTGTVIWSNEQTRLFAFEADGEVRDPLAGDTFYRLAADAWTDTDGTVRADGSYPACLAGLPDEPVTMDRHRMRLEVIHQSFGGPQRTHFAVTVGCLPG
jgi:hypothetical protein